MEAIDWNAKVKEALDRTGIMALSTSEAEGSWTAPVAFSYTKEVELSFTSMPETRHVRNILSNPRVSMAIYKPEPFPDGGNLGLQIVGTVQAPDALKENSWNTFTVMPEEIWCFDSRVSHERKSIDIEKLRDSLIK